MMANMGGVQCQIASPRPTWLELKAITQVLGRQEDSDYFLSVKRSRVALLRGCMEVELNPH